MSQWPIRGRTPTMSWNLLASGDKVRIALMVFPELGISAYAIDDLLFQDAVLDEVERQLDRLISASRDLFPVFAVGAPLRHRGHLYNCGVVIHRGKLLGVVPKVYLPNYREFYERRQLTSGEDIRRSVDRNSRTRSPLRPRSAVRRSGKRGIHLPCRDLRGSVGAAPAEYRCGARRGRNPAQPVGQQHHDRQIGDAPPVVRVASFPLHRGLCLFGGRRRRVDDRPRLGRPGRHLRIERPARRNRALLTRPRDGGRRCRPRPHPAGADAHEYLRR